MRYKKISLANFVAKKTHSIMKDCNFLGCLDIPSIACSKTGELSWCQGFVPHHGELRRMLWHEFDAESAATAPTIAKAPFPVLEFGMAKAGMLAITDAFELPSSMVPTSSTSGSPGSGASTVHSTTSIEAANRLSAATAVHKRVLQAISSQIEARGFFYQPFLVRYALRMTDGTHAALSSPILMMPWMLPPCLALGAAVTNDDTVITTFSNASMRYFSLTCQVLQGIDQQWADCVVGVDVFCSVPIPTFDTEAVCSDGFVTFSGMASTTATEILAGIWAENATDYCEHTLSDLGISATKAWAFSPNPMLRQEIIDTHEFYHIAFVPISSLTTGSAVTLSVPCTSAEALKKRPKLEDTLRGSYGLKPASMLDYNGRVHAIGGKEQQLAPLEIRSSMQACDAVSSAQVQICVLARRDGQEYATAIQCAIRSMPHYFFTAIPDAYAVVISWGVNVWRLPLTPHLGLQGAYWCSDFEADTQYPSGAWVVPDNDAWHPTPNVLRSGLLYADRLTLMDSSVEVGSAESIALVPALKAMSAGQFGAYPLYVFATDGIWAVGWTASGYGSPQLISRDCALGADAIGVLEESVVYACKDGVKLLSGAKVECISGCLQCMSQLPDTVRLGSLPGFLWVVIGSTAYIYDIESQLWGMADEDDGTRVITRPFEGPVETLEIKGLFAEKPKVWVYGSQDLVNWALVASAQAARLEIDGSQWRYHILVIECDTAKSLVSFRY